MWERRERTHRRWPSGGEPTESWGRWGHDRSRESVFEPAELGAREAACQARRLCMETVTSDACWTPSTGGHASLIISAPSLRPMRPNKGALRTVRMPRHVHSDTSKRRKNKTSVGNRNH
ncbi:hypothetical protein AVEN_172810-1 [Araneus ventricosus]|uniref:Uncharacterized protein n=1 Tax=Araneus ventricosus TaxID=182803 RepID=A0A4Y2BKK9_ARAVE|nr:hypothetical protein AVEN_172810-1 [Araneus ventricosus]